MVRRAFSLVLVLFLAVAPARSSGKIPTLGETIEVSIINVDVVVTDRSGKRVRGLTKDDFEILEGKTPRTITNFAEYASASEDRGARVETPAEVVPRQPRTIVLFVERMRLLDFEVTPFVDSIRRLLHETIEPGDVVSIVTWTHGGDLRIANVDDPESIDRALEDVTKLATTTFYDPLPSHREDLNNAIAFDQEIDAFRASQGVAPRAPARSVVTSDSAGASAAILAQIAMLEMKARVGAINATINSMAAREGKKVLLLATRRLGEVAGAEFFYASGVELLNLDAKQRFGTEQLMKSIVDNANAAGVTIYPLYAPGTKSAMPDASSTGAPDTKLESLVLMNEMASLTEIAKRTGGMAASNVPEIVRLLPRVEEDISDYYSLAYRVSSSRSDRARDIVVRTKNPDYQVRARRQYVEKSDETRMKDRVIAALHRVDEYGEFAIEGGVDAPRRHGRHDIVPLVVRIPIRNLTLVPSQNKNAGAFTVFIASGAKAGRTSDVTQQTRSFEIDPKDMERALAGHFTYTFDVEVERDADRVAVGVFDEIAKTYGVLRLPIRGTNAVSEGRSGTR